MQYAGFLIRQERLKRNWSQEGLCKGICTVSYLSKIEQGKADASQEILESLMECMGLRWYGADDEKERIIHRAYEILLGNESGLYEFLSEQDEDMFVYSPFGPDWALLRRFAGNAKPLDAELEACMNNKQLALQRLLQERGREAICLFPIGFVHYMAGLHAYNAGKYTPALELLQSAFQLAAQEGRAALMLYCKLTMGNCYANQNNLAAMEQHYTVAERLAETLHDSNAKTGVAYNRAATLLEMGNYEQALGYFESLENPRRMDLHKLAICYEKLGRNEEALAALDRAESAPSTNHGYDELENIFLDIVRTRVSDSDYLKNAEYGKKLLHGFDLCRQQLPSGYALFHLPWVLEWYESSRQYKQAMEVLKDFPDRRMNL